MHAQHRSAQAAAMPAASLLTSKMSMEGCDRQKEWHCRHRRVSIYI